MKTSGVLRRYSAAGNDLSAQLERLPRTLLMGNVPPQGQHSQLNYLGGHSRGSLAALARDQSPAARAFFSSVGLLLFRRGHAQ